MRICLVGGGGRLGRLIAARLAAGGPLIHHSTLVRRPPAEPREAAPRITHDPAAALAGAELIIDVAAPPVAARLAPAAAAGRLAYLAAASGLGAADHAALTALAERAPVLVAANLSLQVAALMAAVEVVAGRLGVGGPGGPEVVIHDLHRRGKRDAPSGTALALAARAGGRAAHLAARAGDAPGEHTVSFFADGERLELSHRCLDAEVFARGACRAAAWLAAQPPGMYDMADLGAAPAARR